MARFCGFFCGRRESGGAPPRSKTLCEDQWGKGSVISDSGNTVLAPASEYVLVLGMFSGGLRGAATTG